MEIREKNTRCKYIVQEGLWSLQHIVYTEQFETFGPFRHLKHVKVVPPDENKAVHPVTHTM